MSKTLDAIFEKGVFRPLRNPDLQEGQQVRLVVETRSEMTDDPLKLASKVYEGLSDREIDEIEQIACHRPNFFRR